MWQIIKAYFSKEEKVVIADFKALEARVAALEDTLEAAVRAELAKAAAAAAKL